MKRILVPVGCRSDEGLSAPIIKRLKEHFEVALMQLIPQDFGASYQLTHDKLYWGNYDLVFITGDRVEMCAAAAAAFHSKVPIAHYYAGIWNNPITTFDDIDRHVITLWSDIQFVESIDALCCVRHLMGSFLSSAPDTWIVGISHLDDLEVDESMVPIDYMETPDGDMKVMEPYDLLLRNAEPLGKWEKTLDIFMSDRLLIHIGGNPDGDIHPSEGDNVIYYPNLPRPQFLGLLKNCQRFITNSSAAIYEAPHFLKPEQIIMVGDRNRNRPKGPFKTGASDRIVEILREWLK